MVEKRRSIELLPVALQTETLSKFFAATVDHLLQPESVEFVSGYIGSKPNYYDPSTDYYVSEPTKVRADYQLPVTAVSANTSSGQITNIMFYDDLINLLKFYGANVENHSRLFDQEYYSWAPPIDIDKFVNYTKYIWVSTGISSITLLDRTDAANEIIGHANYTYVGAYKIDSTGEVITGQSLTVSNDMVLIFSKDISARYLDKQFTVNGVGTAIEFIAEDIGMSPAWNLAGWNQDRWNGNEQENNKRYITIERFSIDQNQWSRNNRWYHEDLLAVTKTYVNNISGYRAIRPIVEYKKNILLWNYGWYGRPDVDLLINNISDVFAEIVGRPGYIYDSIPLADGMRLLVVSDSDPDINNRIYVVNGISEYGSISLTLAVDGQSADGSPVLGDRCVIRFGRYRDTNAWYTPDDYWENVGQQITSNIGPKFALFDIFGNGFIDPVVYPNSNFNGSSIFGYINDTATSPYDSELGFNAKRDQFGSFVFENSINTDTINYRIGSSSFQYVGYKFYQIRDVSTDSFVFGNGWNKSTSPSKQFIVNDFVNIQLRNSSIPSQFEIDQLPADTVSNLPNIRVFRVRNQSQVELTRYQDYNTKINSKTGQPLLEVSAGVLQNGDRIICKTWNPLPPATLNGYYELPLNLTANPNNKDIDTISQSQVLDQFKQILENQLNFSGNPLGSNNYRDTAQDRSLGLSILQHRAPMLKLMTLVSNNVVSGVTSSQSNTDPMLAIQFAQREYIRFYNRFIKTLFVLSNNGFTLDVSTDEWINAALSRLNVGKTRNSTWANSGYGDLQGSYCFSEQQNRTYIPPTATRLGLAPAYKPNVYINGQDIIIQTHDGSRIIMEDETGSRLGDILYGETETSVPRLLTNPIAQAWLQFELNLYNNMPQVYQNAEAELSFDIRAYVPGKWRKTDYTRAEYIEIIRPMFDKWVILNQIDYTANTTFNINDQFTFNYSEIYDRYGEPLPGNWRGIYRWYYDTDRPHTHPWEMLGFSQKPTWWDSEYGPAPYTNGNTRLWNDLRDGNIRQGLRQGVDTTWARPGLLDCLPVDSQGNLLPPLAAGIVVSMPSISQARTPWKFGDGGPVESLWMSSQDYNFAIPQSALLMKPARFVEQSWDNLRTAKIFENTAAEQWIYIDTNSRRSSTEFFVHREQPLSITTDVFIPNESNLSYFGSGGLQHWISEYLISKNLDVTQYFGNLIRGSQPRLAHKVGGYINSSNTGLRMSVDSFGSINYKSQLVPSENIKTYLYRSASIGESFYGGVIVKQVSNGWQIFGYDGIYPFFKIIPNDIRSKKTVTTIGRQQVVTYKNGVVVDGEPLIEQIAYGTILPTRQAVVDFLTSYGRWLENQGWKFEFYDNETNIIYNWKQSAIEFVYWSQANWANGNFIALSPFANEAKFQQSFGNIEFVNGIVKGTYPVLDKSGAMIDSPNLEILRYEDEIVIRPINNQSIYGLRLYSTTVEHVIVLDNITSFNDTIYNDLYKVMQPRIKVFAYRTNNWNGRVDAPGYILYQNPSDNTWTMISNLEKTANDFRKYFNIEQPKNYEELDTTAQSIVSKQSDNSAIDRSDISDLARHTFGYQKRTYLENLLSESSNEFEFYQGFIKQKGTVTAIDKLLRNRDIVDENERFEYYEEFALRVGRYGATALNTTISFILRESEFVNTPQQINLFGELDSTRQANGIIQLIPNDPDYIDQPSDYVNDLFPLRTQFGQHWSTDLPTAGYVKLGETDRYVKNQEEFLTLYTTAMRSGNPLKNRDTIWQFIDTKDGWTVWQITKSPAEIVSTTPSTARGEPTVINCNISPGVANGDIVTLAEITNVDVLNGTWVVDNVDSVNNTFQVPQNSFTAGVGGVIYVYKKVRFATVNLRDTNPPVGGWAEGDMAWVDSGDIVANGWTVYTRRNNAWTATRSENYKVDADLMTNAELYSITPSRKLVSLNYFDPAKGFIPGIADQDVDVKSIIDPARYNRGDSNIHLIDDDSAWGNENVGITWWDLSTVRYIDYEIDDDSYRWKNWGKLAPGTTVDVYEWVRSPVPPSNWASYVAQGQSFSQYGINYTASGKVRNSSNPAWTQEIEYDSAGQQKTWYYFWVSNATTLPKPANRTKTTLELSNIISNPTGYGIPWYAAIDQENIIVSNVADYISSTNTFMKMTYTQKANNGNDHKQWELVRQGDASSKINEYFWLKLQNSLVGFDGLGNPVPDLKLNEFQRYGTLIRPRQSWFKNRQAAAKIYIDKVNSLLKKIALRDAPDKASWINWFFDEEAIPEQQNNYDYVVATLEGRNLLSRAIQDGQTVLVLPVEDNLFRWVIYKWSAINRTWSTERIQQWKTANYWQYIDYYDESLSVNRLTVPDYTVETLADRETITPSEGIVVKINNNGSNLWELYKFIDSNWLRVGLEAGTVEILSSIYDTSGYATEFGTDPYDNTAFDINPYVEFSNIFNAVKFSIFGTESSSNSIELNEIFFTMLNYVLAEQDFVDWIVKTSYVVLKGFSQSLYTGDLYTGDNIDSLLDYINEVRPYRSKIREFISKRTAIDTANVRSTDYDKPPYQGKILSVSNINDANVLATNSTLKYWYENYQRNPNLIRTLKTTILFDRIASRDIGWDSVGWDKTAWEYETGVGADFGAFDRIKQYYQPTAGMPAIDSEDLISGVAYKGLIFSGLGLDINPGWNKSPWNTPTGWNATDEDFERYLDLIIQGGFSPEYDSFYGNGIKRAFKLSKVPQDVSRTVVWSNNVLRQYGVDWIIPNWIANATIAVRGQGYSVDDILEINIENAASKPTVKVTAVDAQGGITNVSIISRGSVDLVLPGTLSLVYRAYSIGQGVGAAVQPVWGGDTLLLNTAPIGEPNRKSVYVLYAGETFNPAPDGEYDNITDAGGFIEPTVANDHAEELYTAKLRDVLRIDVYTQPSGGAPNVFVKTYATDGSVDQFDLTGKPQNNNGVIAVLNGEILEQGLDKDYVVDLYSNKIVFIAPPPAGLLQITVFTVGGTGISIDTPYVIDPGVDYNVGDRVTVMHNNEYDPADNVNRPAVLEVTAVQAVGITIDNGGSNYSINDVLILKDQFDTEYDFKIELKVLSVSPEGEILAVSIESPGKYFNNPDTIEWLTNGNGKNAELSIVWGVADLVILDQGLFASSNYDSFSQLSVQSVDSGIPGNGLIINASPTNVLGTFVETVDGNTSSWTVPFVISEVDRLLVTVDGNVVDAGNIIIDLQTVSLTFTPESGSTIVITSFNTNKFSVIKEFDFEISSGISLYSILTAPESTKPPYASSIVIKNNLPMRLPPMNTYVANGVQTQFAVDYVPPDLSALKVYSNEILKELTTDYTVTNGSVVFNSAPIKDTKIVITVIYPEYGYDYIINQNTLEFTRDVPTGWDMLGWDTYYGWENFDSAVQNGDSIRVITFTEDLSYGWLIEKFISNNGNSYSLQASPFNNNMIFVSVDNSAKAQLIDYQINNENNTTTIEFGQLSTPPFGSVITVRYATGSDVQLPIAWRTLVSAEGPATSIAIDDNRKTKILNDVYTYTDSIEIEDITKISVPTDLHPGMVWIDNELVYYYELELSPTPLLPNRGLLKNLKRGALGTSSDPAASYSTLYYYGDGTTRYFATGSGTVPLAETVYVNNKIQIENTVDSLIGTYSIEIDPEGFPAGRYVVFDTTAVPPAGWKNIRIVSLITDAQTTIPVHESGATVIDAGLEVRLPNGSYMWEPAASGLQYSNTNQSKFLREHSGTRS